MKKFLLSLAALTLLSCSAFAGGLSTVIIAPADPTFAIDIPKGSYVRIWNFVQDNINGTGAVAVTKGTAVMNVVTANPVQDADTQKPVLIAGPAKMSVAPMATGSLFLTYQRQEN